MVSLLLVVVVACLLANVLSFTSVSPLRVNKRLLRSTTLQCAAAADELLPRLKADWKESMKAKQKVRKQAIESITTAIKQKEVDERIVVTESIAVELMAKVNQTIPHYIYHTIPYYTILHHTIYTILYHTIPHHTYHTHNTHHTNYTHHTNHTHHTHRSL